MQLCLWHKAIRTQADCGVLWLECKSYVKCKMKQYNPLTHIDFFLAFKNGQRHFLDLDFEYLEGFSNKDFSNIIFEGCFLYLDFRYSNLTNSKFINCNIKEIDLRHANLTNALMTNCLVESALFNGAIVDGFKFVDNYYFGLTLGQEEFDNEISHSEAYILKRMLSEREYKETMGLKMTDVTSIAEPIVDIWPYVKDLVYENIVSEYVYKNTLVEKVYRNNTSSFDHILLPTSNKNVFTVIIIELHDATIFGYYQLDLTTKYSLG
jgi:Pentapeptide repeats (9 copies)